MASLGWVAASILIHASDCFWPKGSDRFRQRTLIASSGGGVATGHE